MWGETVRNLFVNKGTFLRRMVIALPLILTPIFWISSMNPGYADGIQAPINFNVVVSDWGTIPYAAGDNQTSSLHVLVPLVDGATDYRLFVYSLAGNSTVEILTSSLERVQDPSQQDWYYGDGNSMQTVLTEKFILDSLPAGIEYNFGLQAIGTTGTEVSEIIVPRSSGNPSTPLMTRVRPRIDSLDQSFANPGDLVEINGSNLDWINRNQVGYEDGIEIFTCVEYCGVDPADDPFFAYITIPLANFVEHTPTKITFELPSQLPVGASLGSIWEVVPNAWGARGSLFLTIGSANGEISRSISVTSGSNGAISPGTSSSIADGSSAMYTITPDAGYVITSATVDGASILDLLSDIDGVSKSYTFDTVTENHAIAATFSLPPENPPSYLLTDAYGEYEYFGDGTLQSSFFRLRWTKAAGVLDYKIRVTPEGQDSQQYLFSELRQITNPVYVANNFCAGNYCYATISGLSTGPDYRIEIASVGGAGKSDSSYVSRLYNNDNYPSVFHTYFKPVNISVSIDSAEPGEIISIIGAHLDLAQRIDFEAFTEETLDNTACWLDEFEEENCGFFSIDELDFVSVSPNSISFYVPSSFPVQLPTTTFWEGYALRTDGHGSFGRVQFALSTSVVDSIPLIDHGLIPDILNLNTVDAALALGANFTLGTPTGSTSIGATPENDGLIATQSLVGDQSYGSVIDYTTYAFVSPTTYSITVGSTSNGTISPGTLVSIAPGSAHTYTITPSSGYQIDSATLDGNSIFSSLTIVIGETKSYTFNSVTADHTIAATFALIVTAPSAPDPSLAAQQAADALAAQQAADALAAQQAADALAAQQAADALAAQQAADALAAQQAADALAAQQAAAALAARQVLDAKALKRERDIASVNQKYQIALSGYLQIKKLATKASYDKWRTSIAKARQVFATSKLQARSTRELITATKVQTKAVAMATNLYLVETSSIKSAYLEKINAEEKKRSEMIRNVDAAN
jgi:hypothetical protein